MGLILLFEISAWASVAVACVMAAAFRLRLEAEGRRVLAPVDGRRDVPFLRAPSARIVRPGRGGGR